jgi:hypothetical protein
LKTKPEDVSLDDKINFLMQIQAALKVPGVIRVQSNMAFDTSGSLATSEGSSNRIWRTSPGFTVWRSGTAGLAARFQALKSAGYESCWTRRCSRTPTHGEAVDARAAGGRRLRTWSRRRRTRCPRFWIVAHPTELDRVVG